MWIAAAEHLAHLENISNLKIRYENVVSLCPQPLLYFSNAVSDTEGIGNKHQFLFVKET